MESTNAKMKTARISEKVAGVGIKIAEHGIALRLFSLFIYNFRTRPRASPYPLPASGEREVRAVSVLAFSSAAKEKVPPFGGLRRRMRGKGSPLTLRCLRPQASKGEATEEPPALLLRGERSLPPQDEGLPAERAHPSQDGGWSAESGTLLPG
ncbi:hypothetical protein [Agrobacterium sp. RAC06]|uniref:hypothetical protein n=1 Tax=Agrobacterium sp. RAC06 TaxID=1842536 RepID=UPI00083CD780|nr:hypothetical protein [Agrobacterium sp. RAC06]AOG12393.1 hypothetical protein BSY240_1623 [Agrobacterium sp. RAC06]